MYSCLFAFYILLLNLKYGNFRSVGIECDWSIERLQCPPYGTTDWECLKAHLKCSSGKEYHCVRDERGKWIQTCAEEKTCLKGQEPVYAENSNIICQSCRNPERYEPVESTLSYKFSECRRKKKPCPKAVSYECPNETVKYIQNRMCGCDYENDFIPQNYHFDIDTWKCKDPDDLNCVQDPCPEDALGRKQARGPDYRCSDINVRPKTSPANIPVSRSSSVAIIKTTPIAVKIDAKEEGELPVVAIEVLAIVVGLALVAVLVAFILYVLYTWITSKRFEAPGSPSEALKATSIDYISLILSWHPPESYGGCLLSGYVLEMKEIEDKFWKRFATISQEKTEFKVTGLTDGTTYLFRVAAKNKKGTGEYLEMADSISTKKITVPTIPQSITGYFDKEEKHIKLAWVPPDDDGGSPIIEYRVEYCKISDNTWIEAEPVHKQTTNWTKSNLVGGVMYKFRIQARNEKGFSETQELQKHLQYLSIPSKPAEIHIKKVESDNVILTWKVPEKNGGSTVNFYKIRKKEDEGEWTSIDQSSTTSGQLTNLSPDMKYYFGVCAVNEMGEGDFLDTEMPVVLPKKIYPPDIPEGPVELVIGYTDVILSWQPPKYNGGSPLICYFVEEKQSFWSDRRIGKSGSNETKTHVTNMKEGTQYVLCIYAQNMMGNSEPLEVKFTTKNATKPGKPTGPIEFTDVTEKQITLSWGPSVDDGGSPITGYCIDYYDGCKKAWTEAEHLLQVTTFMQKKLIEGRQYVFHVSAVNTKGKSDPLESSVRTKQRADSGRNNKLSMGEEKVETVEYRGEEGTLVDKGLPGKPADIRVDVQKSKLVVSWKPPKDVGGSNIDKYHVWIKLDENDWYKIAVVESPKDQCKVEPIQSEVKYNFRVYAQNKNGYSSFVETAKHVVLEKVKGFFQDSFRVKPGESINSDVYTEKSPLPSNHDDVQEAIKNNRLSAAEKKGGPDNERQRLLVSEEPSHSVQPTDRHLPNAEKPSPPLLPLDCKTITHNSMVLSWQPSATDGGAPIINYKIEYKTTHEPSWFQAGYTEGPVTVFTASGLQGSTEYWFRVTAYNSVGASSPLESQLSVKTEKRNEIPSQPEDLTATKMGNNAVTLRWKQPKDDGGSHCVGFVIKTRESNKDEWVQVAVSKSDELSCTLRNLPYTLMFFSVASKTSTGIGPAKETDKPVTLKYPLGPPSIPLGPLKASNIDATELTLSWQPPQFKGEAPLTSYILHIISKGSDWEFLEKTAPEATICHITGLEEKERYCFRVSAENQWGVSEPLEMVGQITTKPLEAPLPPTGLTENLDLTSNSVLLTWKAPVKEASSITRYIVEYIDTMSTFTSWNNAGFVTPDNATWTQHNLVVGHEYVFRIIGVNAKGQSEPLKSKKLCVPSVPEPPDRIMVMDIVDGEVKLSWNPPSNDGGAKIEQYRVFWKWNNNNWKEINIVESSQKWFKTEALMPGAYYFAVCAENKVGCGLNAETSRPTIIEKKPGAPVGPINFKEVTADSVTFEWSPPKDAGGSPITSYKLHQSENDKEWKWLENISPKSTSFKAKQLKDGNSYKFSVIAENKVGKGPRLVSGTVEPLKKGKSEREGQGDRTGSLKEKAEGGDAGEDSTEDLEKEKKAEEFLMTLKSIKNWDEFLHQAAEIDSWLKSSLQFPSTAAFLLTGTSEYKKTGENLPHGFKAYESSDKGNSLFNSVSLALFGNENYTYRLRLAAASDAISNMKFYKRQYFDGKDKNGIMKIMNSCLSETYSQAIDKTKTNDLAYLREFTIQMAVRETAMPESKCNPLQVQFLSTATGFRILQYFQTNTQTFDGSFNKKPELVKPLLLKDDVKKKSQESELCIHILWVYEPDLGKKGSRVVNRVVPVMNMKKEETTTTV